MARNTVFACSFHWVSRNFMVPRWVLSVQVGIVEARVALVLATFDTDTRSPCTIVGTLSIDLRSEIRFVMVLFHDIDVLQLHHFWVMMSNHVQSHLQRHGLTSRHPHPWTYRPTTSFNVHLWPPILEPTDFQKSRLPPSGSPWIVSPIVLYTCVHILQFTVINAVSRNLDHYQHSDLLACVLCSILLSHNSLVHDSSWTCLAYDLLTYDTVFWFALDGGLNCLACSFSFRVGLWAG